MHDRDNLAVEPVVRLTPEGRVVVVVDGAGVVVREVDEVVRADRRTLRPADHALHAPGAVLVERAPAALRVANETVLRLADGAPLLEDDPVFRVDGDVPCALARVPVDLHAPRKARL